MLDPATPAPESVVPNTPKPVPQIPPRPALDDEEDAPKTPKPEVLIPPTPPPEVLDPKTATLVLVVLELDTENTFVDEFPDPEYGSDKPALCH